MPVHVIAIGTTRSESLRVRGWCRDACGAVQGLACRVGALRSGEVAVALEIEALQAAHDTLEAKVQERTAELRAAQNERVHAGRLAVLGQMSAGMVHELNQPLAALHTLSDNAVVLIEKGRLDEARGNMGRIGNLVDRLGRLIHQLKVFAHKSEHIERALIMEELRQRHGEVSAVAKAFGVPKQTLYDKLRCDDRVSQR